MDERDSQPSVWLLARLAHALRVMPYTQVDFEQQPLPEQAVGWLQRDDGAWSPVYADGLVGPELSWAQMLAATGEDIGDVIESLIEAGLIDTNPHQDSTPYPIIGGMAERPTDHDTSRG
ncbi:hypothetical protein [Nocardia sp. CNY236]|uniref:hypothetical protein n=1 Tax=Nocardia sp. CNY236 TaxID=1169152 RepID=UPI0012DD8B05|nr:hypothetical protein [Nocardia sp. CNY236]